MRNKEVALILAGGRGKRMDILCHVRPKPVLPFAGRFSVMDFSLNNCARSQVADIGVLVDYRREQMTEYLKEWYAVNQGNVNLQVLPPRAGSYTGTADAVYQNLDYVQRQGADTTLILAGDHVYKMDYRKLMAFHHMLKADVTVGVVRVPFKEAQRFGTVAIDADGRINDFAEKSATPQSNLASMGIYVFNTERLAKRLKEDARETGSAHDFGYSILPRIVKSDRVFAYEFSGYWHDIGTVEAYYETNMELLEAGRRFSPNSDCPPLIEEGMMPVCRTNQEGNVFNSLISPGCVIKGRVENSILSPGVQVEEQAIIRNSLIMKNASIGFHSVVDRCIVDEEVKIGKFCYAGFDEVPLPGKSRITVLGKSVTVPDFTAIGGNCRVMPGIEAGAFKAQVVTSGTTLVHT